jgi:hypothetical protein
MERLMKKYATVFLLCVSYYLWACKGVRAEIHNPAFGGHKNQLSVTFGQSMREKQEELFMFGFCYSQPNEFFKLPGRQSVEIITQRAGGKLSKYNQDAIFGFSQDMISPAVWRKIYAGINLGIYIKSQVTDRIGSKFTFGERVFLGTGIFNDVVLELYGRHFSNGNLTNENAGQNFIGLSTTWNF